MKHTVAVIYSFHCYFLEDIATFLPLGWTIIVFAHVHVHTFTVACQDYEILCDDGQCAVGLYCDAAVDCDDGSDESSARCGN